MTEPQRPPALRRNPGRRVPVFGLLVGLCLALLAIDLLYARHVAHPWEVLFGFYGIFGFVACVLLVLAARVLRKVLMRSEDYWDA